MTTEPPITLDSHRDASGVMGAEMRRSVAVPAAEDREAKAQHVAEMERRLDAPPVSSWAEASDLALFLLQSFAATREAQDPRCAALIARSMADLLRLTDATSAASPTERPTP